MRRMPGPVLQVPGLQHLPDEPEKPVIVDLLCQDRDHYLMVQRSEAVGDISLDKPGRPGPDVFRLAQCGVASEAGAETVGAAGELRLAIRLQQEPYHFADQFIRP